MTIHVSGSLAFDRIMNFPGKFADVILPEKLHILNVSFLIDSLDVKRGGTAGNIAYSLALLGEEPRILASAGKDFQEYMHFIASHKLPTDGIRMVDNAVTAACYLITDRDNNQINGFHPAAMATACDVKPDTIQPGDLAIISPGNLDDMRGLPRMFREKGIRYIYDPGQQIPALSKENLLDAITGSDFLTTNDYELEMVARSTGRTRAEIQELTGCLITTLGERGCRIDNDQSSLIPAVSVKQVVDPTGAGDAFRAGFIKGLVCGCDVAQSVRIGCTAASYCVEQSGTQEHTYSMVDFKARHAAAYGEKLVF